MSKVTTTKSVTPLVKALADFNSVCEGLVSTNTKEEKREMERRTEK